MRLLGVDLAASRDVVQFLVLAAGGAVIRLAIIVLLEERLEPLTEL